ncbi:MAG TPA: MlaD family protein [Segetibacter sp.]|jgi:phospholipid/cholesterol/gamma-HCH transport system substrate-binding protein
MKISNETKVGALTAIAITLLILGFNFLKGKSLFKSGNFLYAKYKDTKGIMVSNPVYVKGLQIGTIYELEEANKNIDEIIVAIKLNKEFNIPVNSFASISASPLGTTTMEITLGDSKQYLQPSDTIATTDNPGLLGDLTSKAAPVLDQIKTTVHTLDSVLRNANSVLDPYTKANLQATIANFNRISASLITTSASLQTLIAQQSGTLNKTMNNVESFTRNLSGNNDKISSIVSNMDATSQKLSKADIEGTIQQMQSTIATLNAGIAKMDSKEGTIGLLLNDKQIYNNLANTTRSLNILMDDVRVNPKRYLTIGVSLFGRKSNAPPLTKPLTVSDTTGTQ